jgi:F-box interacting protein
MSTTRRLHFLSYPGRPHNKYILTSYPLDSILTNPKANFTQFEYSPNNFNGVYPRACFQQFIGSCNGILCFADDYKGLVILWNPSIRKFKELPLFTKPKNHWQMAFGFGYDSSKDKYKVVVVLDYYMPHTTNEGSWVEKIEVKVHTLGTNIWRNIQGYPFGGVPVWGPGKFVSGTINWLVSGSPRFIVSFDLVNESYQKILPRIGGEDMCDLWSIGVLRDCLCVTSVNDVWIMEEYGNKESWTKLFTVPYMREPAKYHVTIIPIYIFEDDQVILKFIPDHEFNVSLYDSKSGTLKPTNFGDFYFPEVCVESLISPYSLC